MVLIIRSPRNTYFDPFSSYTCGTSALLIVEYGPLELNLNSFLPDIENYRADYGALYIFIYLVKFGDLA